MDEEKVQFMQKLKKPYYWLLELQISSFELFGDGKYCLFLNQKIDGKVMLALKWKGLILMFLERFFILNFLEMGNSVFLNTECWLKNYAYLILTLILK